MTSPHRLLALLLALPALASAGCPFHEPEKTAFETVFDPCMPLVVVPEPETTEPQRGSIAAAIAMWNELAKTRLTLEPVEGAPELPVFFQEAPGAFFGLYQDDVGHILINSALEDDGERAITLAHEMGHAFGLFHIKKNERISVMNTPNLTVPPNEGDARALIALWGQCPAPPPPPAAVAAAVPPRAW